MIKKFSKIDPYDEENWDELDNTNFKKLKDEYKTRHQKILINNKDFIIVVYETPFYTIPYYIFFKKIKNRNSVATTLKLIYNLRTRNFLVYDNYNNEIPFNHLSGFLIKNGLTYKEFNDAWYYIEENFINLID